MGRIKKNGVIKKAAVKEIALKLFPSFLSGIFLIAVFPEFNLEFFAWIALIPLFFAIKRSKGFKDSFLAGFITGIVFYAGILYWITYTVRVYGDLPYYIAVFALFLLSGYLALYIAFFAGFAKILINNFKRLGIILVPACWVFFEFLKSTLLTGFPWENLGFSQYLNIPFIQVSNVVGAFGLSFIIVFVNYVIFHFIFSKELSKKQALVELIAAAAIFASVTAYGYDNISKTATVISRKKPVKVVMVQGNIGMFQKWKLTKKRTAGIYLKLTEKALSVHPKLVIWPETSLPFILSLSPAYWNKVMNFVKKNHINLIFGTIGVRFINSKPHYYNRDYMFAGSGRYSYYDKHQLVTFGEYIPLRHQLPFLAHILKGAGVGNFTPGRKFRVLKSGGLKAGSMICYEAYFDSLVRHFSKDGANFYASITDDAWYGRTAAPYQDMSMTVFSAVENDRYVVRAGNSGISGIIAPTGKILEQTKIFKRTFIAGNIKLIGRKTFFALYGNIFAYAAIFVFLLSILYLMLNKTFKKGSKDL